ncbi:MAG TPA: phosphoribosyltransferase [Chthoniobacterales bacterium]|jgi:putative phosphoribosyl transferase|nr:phosphoribosyltransferase [Chthoniobacterales bacterium]
MRTTFRDRSEAGELLAEQLRKYDRRADAIVLALPRGGVPVGYEIALRLNLPLDVFVVRKLGVPGQRELAMGAIASGGVRVLNEDVLRAMPFAAATVADITAQESREVERRERDYRQGRCTPEFSGQTVILVDDGLATGATMLAGIAALRQKEPAKIVVAVPVCPPETLAEIKRAADETVILFAPDWFRGVGQFYEDFAQVSDDSVRLLLARAAEQS